MQARSHEIVALIISTIVILLLLTLAIVILLHQYQKRQLFYQKHLQLLKLDFEKILLRSQIEVQEQTFQHMSREIHDNINLSLTLAKLNLNTLEWDNPSKMRLAIHSSIDLLGTAIANLSNLSKSTSTELIKDLGLINATKNEIGRIQLIGKLHVDFTVTGEPLFLESEKDLIIFRIIQEAFNNIIKHSLATNVLLKLDYKPNSLDVMIEDNGIGFERESVFLIKGTEQAGLKNMYTRTMLFGGEFIIDSAPGKGTRIFFKVPYNNGKQN